MKNRISAALALLVLAAFGAGSSFAQQGPPPGPGGAGGPPRAGGGGGGFGIVPMTVESKAYPDGGIIPLKYSMYGGSTLPDFKITRIPATAQSMAIIFHDLDVAAGGNPDDNLHWMAWNIPPETRRLREGLPTTSAELPDGGTQTNRQPGNGDYGYMGPCPPSGIMLPHHYTFDLFALDEKLNVPQNATRADILKAMDGHVIGHAVLIGLYHR